MLYFDFNILSKNVQLQMMREKFGLLKTIIISNEWSTIKFSLVIQKSFKIFNKCCNFHNIGLKLLFLFQNGKPISSSWKVVFTFTSIITTSYIPIQNQCV
jgi:hypothetical protein